MYTCVSTAQARTKCVSAFWAQSEARHFSCKFPCKVALVKCWHAFRLRRLAQSVCVVCVCVHVTEILPRDLLRDLVQRSCQDTFSGDLVQRHCIGILLQRSCQEVSCRELANRALIEILYRDLIKRSCQETSYRDLVQEVLPRHLF